MCLLDLVSIVLKSYNQNKEYIGYQNKVTRMCHVHIIMENYSYGIYGILGLVGITLLKRYFNGPTNTHNPTQSGKVIVITGANTGLGFVAA